MEKDYLKEFLSCRDFLKFERRATSSFTKGAIDYAQNQSIILINGEKLAQLMIEYNVGTYTSHTYEIKLIDSDYFNIGE